MPDLRSVWRTKTLGQSCGFFTEGITENSIGAWLILHTPSHVHYGLVAYHMHIYLQADLLFPVI
jgi:hypothetical protein